MPVIIRSSTYSAVCNVSSFLKYNYLSWAVFFIVAIYALCFLENYGFLTSNAIKAMVHEHMLTNAENSFFEVFSAIAWLVSCIVFLLALLSSIRKGAPCIRRLWFSLYLILCLFALGEEVSWGDHLFDYSHDLTIVQMNAQKETNIHNINAAKIFGITEESVLYPYVSNLGDILTPLFYLLLAFIWVFLPFVKQKTHFGLTRLFKNMPVPSDGFMVLFILHGIVFIIIDVTLFNVGQVFEMFISLAAVIVALDMTKRPDYKGQ